MLLAGFVFFLHFAADIVELLLRLSTRSVRAFCDRCNCSLGGFRGFAFEILRDSKHSLAIQSNAPAETSHRGTPLSISGRVGRESYYFGVRVRN